MIKAFHLYLTSFFMWISFYSYGETWVVVSRYSDLFSDHIHLSLFSKNNLYIGCALNIWFDSANSNVSDVVYPVSLRRELSESKKSIIFYSSLSQKKIIEMWAPLYKRFLKKRSLWRHNCAKVTKKMVERILGSPLSKRQSYSRVCLFVWLPSWLTLMATPDNIFKRVHASLNDQEKEFVFVSGKADFYTVLSQLKQIQASRGK